MAHASHARSKAAVILCWAAQLAVAAVFATTFWFKFTYAPETRYIFGELGGRPAATFAGAMELLCAILLLIPRTAAVGAALALGTMGGAVLTHLFKVGVKIPNVAVVGDALVRTGGDDGGTLFIMALGAAAAAGIVLIIRRRELPIIGARLP